MKERIQIDTTLLVLIILFTLFLPILTGIFISSVPARTMSWIFSA